MKSPQSDPSEEFYGVAYIPRWLQRDTTVSGHAKLVYIALTSHTSKTNASFPSHATIARESDISVSSVKVALNELRALGVVRWEKRRRTGSNASTSNEYEVSTTVQKLWITPVE